MSVLVVRPSGPLNGTIRVSGAKNSVLKLMAACCLAQGRFVFSNVPRISDVECMADVLRSMGMGVGWTSEGNLEVEHGPDLVPEAPYELVVRMRASTAMIGPLLARYGRARVAMPGGDDFGSRPVDFHLRALEQLGASFDLSHGYIEGRALRLQGTRVVLEYPSVGATENLLMAAVLAEGETVIENAACEPEIADLGSLLNHMGAHVLGAGTATITITGVDALTGTEHRVVPDRIETSTYLALLGAAGGELEIEGCRSEHVETLVRKLGMMGMRISPTPAGLWAMAPGRLRPVDLATMPYPGLATDALPMLCALCAVADGTSFATENIFGGRFGYVGELARMGADITVDGHHMVIRGREWLSGAPVRALDIRAGAALLVAGVRAEGETVIHGVEHLDRGYEGIEAKLAAVGVDVHRRDDGDPVELTDPVVLTDPGHIVRPVPSQ